MISRFGTQIRAHRMRGQRMGTTLWDKFYGGICGCHIGSAMGAPVEGMPYPFGYATSINPHTNSRRTLRENADGVYHAFKNRLKKEREYTEMMDIE